MMAKGDSTLRLQLALSLYNSGKFDEAKQHCLHILQHEETHSGALHILSLCLQALGDLDSAEEAIANAHEIAGDEPPILNSFGLVKLAQGDLGEARSFFERAISIEPGFAAAHINLGHARRLAGDFAAAEESYTTALKLAPNSSDALVHLSLLLKNRGEFTEIERLLDSSTMKPEDDPGIAFVHGLVALEHDRLSLSEECFRIGLQHLPKSVPLLTNLGVSLSRQRKVSDAIDNFHKALAIDPNNADIQINLGDTLKYDKPEEARSILQSALNNRPNDPNALDILGFTWLLQGKLNEAIAAFDKAIEANQFFDRAKYHKACALFLAGNLAQAWHLYIARYGVTLDAISPLTAKLEPANDKDLRKAPTLIWTDQGIGDEILQLSMVDELTKNNAAICIATSGRLTSLVRRSFPTVTVIDKTEVNNSLAARLNLTHHFPGGALGSICRLDFASFPCRHQYLMPCPEMTRSFKELYQRESGSRPLVGLSWMSTNKEFGDRKSISIGQLEPILTAAEACFVNLQYGRARLEAKDALSKLGGPFLTDEAVDPLTDLDQFAAQVASMDLVITTSNSTAHLAGALGVPTLTLIPRIGPGWLWYWFAGRNDSPWYPSMRLFRQGETGDWSTPITAAARYMAQFLSERQTVTTN